MRVLGELARAYGDGTVRVTPGSGSRVPVGERRATSGSCTGAWPRRGSGWPKPGPSPTSPAARARRSCRLAVTQSRGLGRLLEEHLRARPDLIAAADGARIKISGCPNGCGQHHIATIGFQGSVRRLGGRAVPQYFVMVGGGAIERGASFGRAGGEDSGAPDPGGRGAADRPLRARAPGGRDRRPTSSAASSWSASRPMLRRPRAAHRRATPCRTITSISAEAGEFAPVVMDGECSA